MGGVSRFVFYKSEAAEAVLKKVIIYLFQSSITFYELQKTGNFDFESVYRIKTMKNKGLV